MDTFCLALILIVCPIQAFMNISISNINKLVETLFLVMMSYRIREVSRISKNAERLSSQAFNVSTLESS
jgi:hypothetical protein